MHALQASVEHDSAADSVLRLLSNSMLPESSRLPILYQAIPLLERQQLPPLFSAKNTSKMLAHSAGVVRYTQSLALVDSYYHTHMLGLQASRRGSKVVCNAQQIACRSAWYSRQELHAPKVNACCSQAATAAEDKASQRQDVSAIQLCLARNLARAQIAGAVA